MSTINLDQMAEILASTRDELGDMIGDTMATCINNGIDEEWLYEHIIPEYIDDRDGYTMDKLGLAKFLGLYGDNFAEEEISKLYKIIGSVRNSNIG